jgi:L-alanine-DL-glutamate epimerase-like enolase superfamily enzyme
MKSLPSENSFRGARDGEAVTVVRSDEHPAQSLRIAKAKVIVTSPGRNFVTLKIETADGLYGLGDATLNGRELAVASYLADHVIPTLIDRDAHQIEDIWQYLTVVPIGGADP